MKTTIILLFSLLFTSANLQAKGSCDEAEYQQFDFWLGQWQVTNPENNQVSESKITKILGGCVLLEEYNAPSGFQGKSLNIYDKQQKKWHQSWTDNSGLLLQLNGEFIDNSMILKGSIVDDKGKELFQMITWSLLENNKVRQHWQQSIDAGITWVTLFDGTYTRRQ
ncbi:hypothetical protein RGQ13_01310 [Thalassotalea psychrophila]|uniref:DUF1579 domain-containing protein n=1 Tax=Thalassotalea psychrophila TaxID=3065647 RepID=A0ABY9TUY4_9GAMM|nr:hypothetical protein RGQ13_01310 [Colwelliaceae bacterium SQ149]